MTTTEKKAAPAKAVKKAPASAAKTSRAKRPELASVANVVLVPLADLMTDQNIRESMDEAALKELARDIEVRGLLQPIVVTPAKGNKYQVVAGHRRAAAVRLTTASAVPAVVTKLSAADAKAAQLAENIQREDLSLLEEGRALLALRNEGMSLSKLGELVNKSRSWVCKRIACVENIPYNIRELMEEGVTEDAEILLTLKELYELDWCRANQAMNRLRAGEETRDSLRELVRKAKEPKADLVQQMENEGGDTAAKLRQTDADASPEAQAKREAEAAQLEADRLAESRRRQGQMQCEAWRLINEAKSEETTGSFLPFQEPLQPEARAFWKDVIGDAVSANPFELMMMRAARDIYANTEDSDLLVVMTWAGMKRQKNLMSYPTEDDVDALLKQFVAEFREMVVSHAKRQQ